MLMCFVVPQNAKKEMGNVMFSRELINGFSYSNVKPFKSVGAQFGPFIPVAYLNYTT